MFRLLLAPLLAAPALSQLPESGSELYEIGCAKCHGSEGRGVDPSLVGFSVPVPDFTDCRFASREADADWIAVTHQGGPVRGFDSAMPAFGEAFDLERIERIVEFMRSFCSDSAWPRGELNLPLPLVTEKAFPEDEVLWTTSVNLEGEGAFATDFVYERRVGARHQWEASLPLAASSTGGAWVAGIGDVGLGWKSAFWHTGDSILTAGGEVFFPAGDNGRDLGTGTVVFEPYLAFGRLLPRNGFLQLQGGAELPADETKAERELFWRAVVGWSVSGNAGFGRTWAPMMEILGSADAGFDDTTIRIVPQFQVSLSTRQHVRLNLGIGLPLTRRDESATELLFYLLWDWFDGGLFKGW